MQISCCRIFLRSGHGRCSCKSLPNKCYSLSDKAKVPKVLLRSRSWLRRHISVGGSLRARSPDPAQVSSLREQSAQDATSPQVPQAPQTVGARAHRLCPLRTATAIRSAVGMGKGFTTASRPGPRPGGGPSEGSGALQDTTPSLFPGPPQHTCWPEAR